MNLQLQNGIYSYEHALRNFEQCQFDHVGRIAGQGDAKQLN